MWWAVVLVFISHLYQDMALLKESEDERILDFNDYQEDSSFTSTKLDQSFKTGYVTPATKIDLDILLRKRRKENIQYLELDKKKDIDLIESIFNEYGLHKTTRISHFSVTNLFTTPLSKEKTNLKNTAINQDMTPKLVTNSKRHDVTRTKEVSTGSNTRIDISDLTTKTKNYHITAKEGYITITKQELTSSEPLKENFQTKIPEVITWQIDTHGTVTKYTITDKTVNYENARRFEYSHFDSFTHYQDTNPESENILTQLTLAKTVTSKDKAALYSEETSSTTPITTLDTSTLEVSTESTFVIPRAVTVNEIPVPGTKYLDNALRKYVSKAIGRKKKTTTQTTTTEKTTITMDFKDKHFDMKKLLQLFDYVVADDVNYFNLSQKFNETLQKYTIPTCPTTPSPTPLTPPSTINYDEAPVVAKCFVCGLDVEGIPYSSACADAFAGDFIPLVPVDPKARGQIARYRKYCRYLDANRVITKDDEPHSLFGRFTGGCSVRWVDLTGVYTQRACRNRRRAVMGKHFASKRMAKLEMALNDVENGCIISPMATLLPVSRGISLYARFHACVCTGSWCNKAVVTKNWMWNTTMMLTVVVFVS